MESENALRRVHRVDLVLAGRPERVFPLLCPVLEYDWIDGWSAVMVYSQSGVAERGCVFRTRSEVGDETWTVSRYEPSRAIEFVRVVAGVRVLTMDFDLAPGEAETTKARVTYTYTALGPDGTAAIEQVTPQRQEALARRLETMLNHYLRTGARLPAHQVDRLHGPAAS